MTPITPTTSELRHLDEHGWFERWEVCQPQPECCYHMSLNCFELRGRSWCGDMYPIQIFSDNPICTYSPFGATGETYFVREDFCICCSFEDPQSVPHKTIGDRCHIVYKKMCPELYDIDGGETVWSDAVEMDENMSRYTIRSTVTLERREDVWQWYGRWEVVG